MSLRLARLVFLLWLVMFLLFLRLWYYPIMGFHERVLTSVAGFIILAGAIYYSGKHPFLRGMLLLSYGIAALFLLWPSHQRVNSASLSADYCQAMKAYTKCPYVWGGEGYLGIDCSGLVRKGMEDALTVRGLKTLNPSLVREAIWLYWNDTTARVMGQGYGGRVRPVMDCQSLNQLNYSPLHPGDLAVTIGGEHVMAYIGNKTWIAADPGAGGVTSFVIPEQEDPYFRVPMHIVRWKILDESKP